MDQSLPHSRPHIHHPSAPGNGTLILLGIDGAGKSTVARLLVRALLSEGAPARRLAHPAGRRLWARLDNAREASLPARFHDMLETGIRLVNVAASTLHRQYYAGFQILDRHVYCQLALRRARGLPPGRWLPLLARYTAGQAQVVLLDVDAATAYQRICQRGEDHEPFEHLRRLRLAYLELAAQHHWEIVDATPPAGQVACELRDLIDACAPARLSVARTG